MNKHPTVSIITPSYNQAGYLGSTIQSVIKQDYPDLEYAVIDGGSQDHSLQVIKQYQDQLSWWVSESDQGQAHAINKGMEKVGGEIVGWLNSDDLYLPGAVQCAVNELITSGSDLVFGNALTIDAQGRPLNVLEFGDWGLPELMRFRVICQPAVFLKRSVWNEVGGLDQDLHYMLDHQLWLKVAARFRVKHIPYFLAASRHHLEAKNVSAAVEFAGEIEQLVQWMTAQEKLADYVQADSRRVRGGAKRLAARYLLDGGFPGRALGEYLKALYYWPKFAVKHGHRMAYAFLSLVAGNLKPPRTRRKYSFQILEGLDLSGWPGIQLGPRDDSGKGPS